MTLRVSGKNLAIGEALRTHVHNRIDGVTAKYNAGSPTGHVTIEPEGSGYRADCTLFLKAGFTLQVEAIAQEPYASFDKAADRIERRLRDHRKRINGHHGEPNGGSIDTSEAEAAALPPLAELEAADEAGQGERFAAVIAERTAGFDKLTVAGAVKRMDDEKRHVVVFRVEDDERINIVYRRADGNIGWIDPAAPVAH